MAEVVGITASAITLAALFSKCIECFSYFKAAQNCPDEAESLLVKLDCEKARLLAWANTVGILQTDPQRRHSQLVNVQQDSLIQRCIEQIITLLTDAHELQDMYGGRATSEVEIQHSVAVLSKNSMDLFKSTRRTFFARVRTNQNLPGLLSRIKWAIRDAGKFRILILNLRDFVDHLIGLVPISSSIISSIVEEDIVSTVNIEALRLIENGCDENYPSWSARASEVIKDSEIGTVDRRNLLEIVGDEGISDHANTAFSQTRAHIQAAFSKADFSNTFIALTANCLNVQADGNGHCDESKIRNLILRSGSLGHSFVTSETWSIGRRLYEHLTQPYGLSETLQKQQEWQTEYARLSHEIPRVAKLSKLIVYCGACICAIRTALTLLGDEHIPDYIDVIIRIDDRLPTSCRNQESAVNMLEAIREELEHGEMAYSLMPILKIDWPALEKRIFALEQGRAEQVEPEMILHRLVNEENGDHRRGLPLAGVLIIAESDMCSESLNFAPFRSQSRMSRAGEIYKFDTVWNDNVAEYDKIFIGRLNRSKAWTDKAKTHREDATALVNIIDLPCSQSIHATTSTKRLRSDSTTS